MLLKRVLFVVFSILVLAFVGQAQNTVLTGVQKEFRQNRSHLETQIINVVCVSCTTHGKYLNPLDCAVTSLENGEYKIRDITEWVNYLLEGKKINLVKGCPRCETGFIIHLLPSKDGKMNVNYQEKLGGDEIIITVRPEALVDIAFLHPS